MKHHITLKEQRGMHILRDIRYEARMIGPSVFALPVIAVVLFLGAAVLIGYEAGHAGAGSAASHHDIAQALLFMSEAVVPLVCGLAAAALIDTNPAKETHMALPVTYAHTMRLRLAIFVAWAVVIGALIQGGIVATGFWQVQQTDWRGPLIWLAPTLWCISVGATLALLFDSWVTSTTLLSLGWFGEFLTHNVLMANVVGRNLVLFATVFAGGASYWLLNRLTLLVMALLLFLLCGALLRRNEALLAHETS